MSSKEPEDDSLEIKDSEIIFNNVWNKVTSKYGVEKLRFPKEIIWLMGAPGAGKSYNAPWILRARGITARELVISSLLTSEEAKKAKRDAGLVGDSLVVELLLEHLLHPKFDNGVLVDGFPRTKVQVDCIKMLRDKMLALRQEFSDTSASAYFRRPVFRVAVLFVDENTSVERQLKRGREVRETNLKVKETNVGEFLEERETDFSEELARRRYLIFKQHYSTLQELQKVFTFSVVNTKAPIEKVREDIMKEFVYQSSLELASPTYDKIVRVPTVADIIKHARQKLVRRLDHYQTHHPEILEKVIESIEKEFVPNLEQHCISGEAQIRTINELFEQRVAVEMVLDVLAERGFHATSYQIKQTIPREVDLKTGQIKNSETTIHVFDIRFKKSVIRQDFEHGMYQ